MNTISQVNNTLNQTMSLLELNFQLSKLSSKATIEFVQSYSNDLTNDIMQGIRNMHNKNLNKEAPQDPELMFGMFQEIIQDAIEQRIELLKLDIPTKKRGRVSKKKPLSKDIVAVDDSDDESSKKKRGRKKKVVTKTTKTDAMAATGLKMDNTKPSVKKIKSAFKIFRRIEKMVEKPKGSGKFKRSVPWRNITYELKEGEKWLDTWSVSEKQPKRGSITYDHHPTDEEFAAVSGKKPVKAKPVVEAEAKPVVEAESKPVLKKQPELVEDNKNVIEEANQVKETVKKIVSELEEDKYEVSDDDEESQQQEDLVVSSFTPSGEYLPFTAIDGEDDLIYYTDKSIKQYGMVVDCKTGEMKGWILNEDADELVDNKPEYEHEESDEDEDEDEDEINLMGF